MFIFDSFKKEKVPFIPIKDDEVSIYVCGPTVYDSAHLGHARGAIVFDLLHRFLKAKGYKVTFAKNFTDIDDKIINRSIAENRDIRDITEYYINEYLSDMEKLNVLRATIEPKATEALNDMYSFIQTLIDKNMAYILDDGIYFDTSKDSEYGTFSHQSESDFNRVKHNSSKKDIRDFALFKFSNEFGFPSPFGKGRPGWHLECSVMIDKYLAKSGEFAIDIHGGGADLIFPHHENEVAQTRCAKNQKLAKYWIHNGFVTINNSKMSKSLGNSFFIKDALKVYDGEVLRFYLLQTHYRSSLNFAEEDLLSSKKRLDKLYRLKKRVFGTKAGLNDKFKNSLFEVLDDDLNISKALALLDEYISYANEELDKNEKNRALKEEIVANLELIENVLGVGYQNPFSYFQIGIDSELKAKIDDLIAKRAEVKKAKNFALADTIRDEILSFDIKIMDTALGTFWEKI